LPLSPFPEPALAFAWLLSPLLLGAGVDIGGPGVDGRLLELGDGVELEPDPL
jgi:hypothetical protein